MEFEPKLHSIPDDELIRRLGELVSQSRRVEADLVAHIGEVDARGLYARHAFPSMFAYCTEALHLSEAEAYRRITVARAARKHALLLTMLRDREARRRACAPAGRPFRDAEVATAASGAAAGYTTGPGAGLPCGPRTRPGRVATEAPAPPAGLAAPRAFATTPAFAAPAASAAAVAASRPAVVEPLSPARYEVQFTASGELHDKLERLAALMRSLTGRPHRGADNILNGRGRERTRTGTIEIRA